MVFTTPDSKVHVANKWGRQDPGGPHVGPMNFAIQDIELTGLVFHEEDYVKCG